MYAKIPSIEFELHYTLQAKRSSSEVMFFSKNVLRPRNESELINILER